jgi:DNA-directed RNA polymerase subunit alpha
MVSATEAKIDLFGANLPCLEELQQLATFVHSSERNRISFKQQLDDNISRTTAAAYLAAGIGLFILGDDEKAIEKLQKSDDCKEKFIYLAYAQRRKGNFDEAMASLDKAREHQADELSIMLAKAATLRHALRFEQAAKQFQACANFERVSAEYHYQLARLQEAQGLYEEAMDNYQTAIELEPEHSKALFHLAYACDLRGDEQAAIDYYKQITTHGKVYISALLNLAVIYEDLNEYDKASRCVDVVLKSHPNHQRAKLFKQDIESSKTMLYDEEKEKRLDRRVKILETPISDFELSVRSRNCLKRMNIETIGDLLRTTEADLLAYKNFGETSLNEIKAILASRNLQLGMALEDRPITDSEESDQEPVDTQQELLQKSVDDIELSVRSRKCLQRLNVRTIGDLINKTDAELLGCKNFGVTSLNEVKQRLSELNLSLRSLE